MTLSRWDRACGRVLQALRKQAKKASCPTCGDSAHRSVNQEDVAELLGVTQTTVSNFETARSWPSSEELAIMLRYYRTPLDTFWRLVEEERGAAA